MAEMNFKEYTELLRNEKSKLEATIQNEIVKFVRNTGIQISEATILFIQIPDGGAGVKCEIKLDL